MARRTPRPTLREKHLRRDIKALETIEQEARNKGSFGPATSARAKIAQLRKEYHRMRDIRLAKHDNDPLESLRHRLSMAEADGSWQAVAQLSKAEAELVAKLADAEALAAQAEMQDLSQDELLGIILGAVDVLPYDLLDPIIRAVSERLGEEALAASLAGSPMITAADG